MPSNALLLWRNDRVIRLNDVDAQCAAPLALVPPNPNLADENLRGYVMLLSAHFQGFCRDLHTDCIQAVTAAVAVPLQTMIQAQCLAGRDLDATNPRYATIRKDFERFGLDLQVALAANPANLLRITHLDHLNAWRNYAAHHKTAPPLVGGPFGVVTVRTWKDSATGWRSRWTESCTIICRRSPGWPRGRVAWGVDGDGRSKGFAVSSRGSGSDPALDVDGEGRRVTRAPLPQGRSGLPGPVPR
jgi:hypothetical protein